MKAEGVRRRNPAAWRAVGGLSAPSKMPCFSISLPAQACGVGKELVKVPGSVCSSCYALKGNYVWPNVEKALWRRLHALRRGLKSGRWQKAMVTLLRDPAVEKNGYFRWHDSGDLQSLEHLDAIAGVAEATPAVKHWLPTREARIVGRFLERRSFPANLLVRLSLPMLDMARPPGFDVRLATSGAHSLKGEPPAGAKECPAPRQGGRCGKCRNCWSGEVRHVSYLKH